ncbi:MAG: hypothetical protein KJO61_13040 [Deltaproteobacteria bacterium]|nr:hypothetical protein [Deltaproteobacteria bacterium]
MKKITKTLLCVFVVVLIAMFSTTVIATEDVVIIGTINEDYQLVEDSGAIYDIDENEMGDELTKLIGKKVEVIGTLVDTDGALVITVVSYTILDE